ncbi:MAG: hypothetical protein VX278_12665, partial [Myxococcota bacterium]|nr:hypothetical protein [Myxococcota bacterium]
MSLHVNIFIGAILSSAHAEEPIEYRIAHSSKRIYSHVGSRNLKGILTRHQSFAVFEHFESTASCSEGWAQVHQQGFVCLNGTEETNTPPTGETEFLDFIPPDPLETGYELPADLSLEIDASPFMPSIHARILDGSRGRLWASVEDYEAGNPPNWRLKEDRDYRFVDILETKRGLVLERPNGKITPVEEWFVYPVSQFSGRALDVEPIPNGEFAAWAIDKEGAPIYEEPTEDSDVLAYASFQEALNVYETTSENWYGIRDIFGSHEDGFIMADHLRVWESASRPKAVADDQIWFDVDLSQQTLGMFRGDSPLFLTLISSAREGYKTPTGLFAI